MNLDRSCRWVLSVANGHGDCCVREKRGRVGESSFTWKKKSGCGASGKDKVAVTGWLVGPYGTCRVPGGCFRYAPAWGGDRRGASTVARKHLPISRAKMFLAIRVHHIQPSPLTPTIPLTAHAAAAAAAFLFSEPPLRAFARGAAHAGRVEGSQPRQLLSPAQTRSTTRQVVSTVTSTNQIYQQDSREGATNRAWMSGRGT